jgi:general secretion pathway protein G
MFDLFHFQRAQERRLKPSVHPPAGFTLIELLVVATIIIVLTTIGIISYNQSLQSSRNARRKSDLEIVRQALVLYKADNGYYPNTDYDGLLGSAGVGTTYISTLPLDPKITQSDSFAYTYTPANCSSTASYKCQSFTLTAVLETSNGMTDYEVASP